MCPKEHGVLNIPNLRNYHLAAQTKSTVAGFHKKKKQYSIIKSRVIVEIYSISRYHSICKSEDQRSKSKFYLYGQKLEGLLTFPNQLQINTNPA